MVEYSDQVLEDTPPRVTQLLGGMGAVTAIRTALYHAGLTDDQIDEGVAKLLDCLSIARSLQPPQDTPSAVAQRAATVELDATDEPLFRRARATLERHYPAAAEYLFRDNLKAAQGMDAVRGIATFLLRVEALEKGADPQRAASREDDRAAVALLAKRGIDAPYRASLDAKVKTALGPTTPVVAPPVAPEERRRKLIELKRWYDEWAETAHAVITKRSYLIRLGLAERRSPTKPEPVPAPGDA